MDLVTEISRASQAFPKEEIFGFASQIRRLTDWETDKLLLLAAEVGRIPNGLLNSLKKM